MLDRREKATVSAVVLLIVSSLSLIPAFSQEQKDDPLSEPMRFASRYIDTLVRVDNVDKRIINTWKVRSYSEVDKGVTLMSDVCQAKSSLRQSSISLSEFARSKNKRISETAETLLEAIESLIAVNEGRLTYLEKLFNLDPKAKEFQAQREQLDKEDRNLFEQRQNAAFDAIVMAAKNVYLSLLNRELGEEGKELYLVITAKQREELKQALVDNWGPTVKEGFNVGQSYPCAAAAGFYTLLSQPMVTQDERPPEKGKGGTISVVMSVTRTVKETDSTEAFGFANNFIDILTYVDAAEKGINQATGERGDNARAYGDNLIKNIRQGIDNLERATHSLGGAMAAQDSTIKDIVGNLMFSTGLLIWNYNELLRYVERLYDPAKATEGESNTGKQMSEQSKLMATRAELLNIFYTITPAVCGCLLSRQKDEKGEGPPLVITSGQREQLKKAIVDFWGEEVTEGIKENRSYTFYAAARFYSFLSQTRRSADREAK